jgi:hypothetical protein
LLSVNVKFDLYTFQLPNALEQVWILLDQLWFVWTLLDQLWGLFSTLLTCMSTTPSSAAVL